MLADALDKKVFAVIARNPRIRAAEIAEKIGEPSVDVRRSLARLKFSKKVRSSGNTRATVYRASKAAQ